MINKQPIKNKRHRKTRVTTALKVDRSANKNNAKKNEPKKDQSKTDEQEQPASEENTECGQLIKALNALNTPQEKYPEFISSIKETRNDLIDIKEVTQRLSDTYQNLSVDSAFFNSVYPKLIERIEKLEAFVKIPKPEPTEEQEQLIKDNKALRLKVSRLEKQLRIK